MFRSLRHLAFAAAVVAAQACGNSTHAEGRVTDTKGRPVRGVVVRLESGPDTARGITNAAGRYSVTQHRSEEKASADLTFCKPNYYLARRWFDDARSMPAVLNVMIREIDTTAAPARVAGARAPCAALGVGTPTATGQTK